MADIRWYIRHNILGVYLKVMKNTFMFLFYLLAGIIVGSLIGNVCIGVPGLTWLGYAKTIGFAATNPAVLDLIIVKITFGFSMSVSVAQIIAIILAVFVYNRAR